VRGSSGYAGQRGAWISPVFGDAYFLATRGWPGLLGWAGGPECISAGYLAFKISGLSLCGITSRGHDRSLPRILALRTGPYLPIILRPPPRYPGCGAHVSRYTEPCLSHG
jgi:hypothetical protein